MLRATEERVEAIDSLTRTYIEKGELAEALKSAKLGASSEVIALLVKAYLKEGKTFSILKAQETAELVGVSPETVDLLLETCIRRGEITVAKEIVKLKGRSFTGEELDSFLKTFLSRGQVTGAKRVARLMGRNLTPKEIDFLIEGNIRKKWLWLAQKAAKIRGRSLTIKEILRIEYY